MKMLYNAPKITMIDVENSGVIADSLGIYDDFGSSDEQLTKGRLPYNDWDNIWK